MLQPYIVLSDIDDEETQEFLILSVEKMDSST